MRGKFVSGMVLGAIGGAIIGMMFKNPMKASSGRYLMGKAKRVGRRRAQMVKDMADDVRDWLGK
ncbi:MAG: hypothetical protein WAO24_04350 [Peptococcia bacterium]